MYNNIIYFEHHLSHNTSKAFSVYLKAVNDGVIINPIVFCDSYDVIPSYPVFHTFYIKNNFHPKIILTNKFNYNYLNAIGLKNNIIVVYDSSIETTEKGYLSYDYSSNQFYTFLKDNI